MRVLLIEDDDGIRSALGKVLKAHAHEVAEAATAENACLLLDTRAFDVVVLDVNLPDAPGWDVITHLQKIPHRTEIPRIIVMSAVPPSADRLREVKPSGVLLKPFPVSSLLRLVAADPGTASEMEVS